MKFPNGNQYSGNWKDDVQHGMGVLINAKEGNKRQGEWKNGKRTAWLGQPTKVIVPRQ